MALKFSTTKDAGTRGVKVMVYGPAGVGKTVLCATAPDPVILSAEAGLLSLREKEIPVIEIGGIKDLEDAYNFLMGPDGKKFKTICLDSLTEIGEQVLAEEKAKTADPRQAYGVLIESMQKLVKMFRDIPDRNVYFSVKEEAKTNENNVTRIMPAMPGSRLGEQLPYYFDEVLHMEIGKTEDGKPFRLLRTVATFQAVAKDRSGALEEIEEPNLTKIFDKITKGI